MQSQVWAIFAAELQRPQDETVERILRRIARLPKPQRTDAVRQLVAAVVEMKVRPSHSETLVFLPKATK